MASDSTVPLYLTDEYIRDNKLLVLDKLIPAIEKSMASASKKNEVIQPQRTFLKIPSRNGVLLTMPGFSEPDDALACKLVTAFPKNSAKGLPTIIGTVILFDTTTGKVSAIMDGTEITTWRTAAASVVATKHLHNDTKSLAVLGSGTQGRSHIEAMDHFFKFKEIRVWNHRYEGAEKLANDLSGKGKNIKAFKNAEDCVKYADIIVTATFANSPILKGSWIKPGAHINAVGAGVNHHSELDMELYQTANIYTDTMASTESELKGLIDAGITIIGEIGEIINGSIMADRKSTTVFQSNGMAVEDVISAKLIYEEYKKMFKSS